MLMALNFCVTIYIVDELFSRKNISHDCLVFGCLWVVVQKEIPIRFGPGVSKCIYKPLAVSRTYLLRHGAGLRCFPTVTKHHTLVKVK